MENKQSLRIYSAESDTIAAIDCAECSYIDNTYYCKTMNEDPFIYYGNDDSKNIKDLNPNYTSYPVKVQALNIEWIVEPEGKLFLLSILNSGNVDLYQVPYI